MNTTAPAPYAGDLFAPLYCYAIAEMPPPGMTTGYGLRGGGPEDPSKPWAIIRVMYETDDPWHPIGHICEENEQATGVNLEHIYYHLSIVYRMLRHPSWWEKNYYEKLEVLEGKLPS